MLTEAPRAARQGSRKLHIGCFDQVLPGWTNTDITPHILVARIPGLASLLHRFGLISEQRFRQHRQGVFRQVHRLDARRRFPYPDGAFDCVYSSHMLEHLPPADAEHMMRECRRVMKTGGVLRLAIPDLDQIVAGYRPEAAGEFLHLVFEAGHARRKNAHHWHYNAHLLSAALKRAGFCRVERRSYRQGDCADVDLIDTRPDSLFMEACK